MYLDLMSKNGIKLAQNLVKDEHYLHAPVDVRGSVEGYWIGLDCHPALGLFLLGRPQATKVAEWYGGVQDVKAGRCECTRWQVLNLARVWISPVFQPGGVGYRADWLPGFMDRKGEFRSTLASSAISAMAARVGFDYLMRRPPCFLDEPYQIDWLLSYCDTRLHKGTIYQAAGFELYRTNDDGIQTWRLRLPPLTVVQHAEVREAARVNPRSHAYRAKRAQMCFEV